MYINPSVYPSCAQSCPTLFPIPWTVVHTLLCPWDFPSKNTGVSCHFLFQGIFPTLGQNSHLLRLLQCRQIFYHLSHQGSPVHICVSVRVRNETSHTRPERGWIDSVYLGDSLELDIKNLQIFMPFDPVILLPTIHPEKIIMDMNKVFGASLFVVMLLIKEKKMGRTYKSLIMAGSINKNI